MKYASLTEFLMGKLSPDALAEEIADEVASCNEALQFGNVARIIAPDGASFTVTREGVRLLLEGLINGRLSLSSANYVAECIIMSDSFDFEDEIVRDLLLMLADDSGSIAREEIIEALRSLA